MVQTIPDEEVFARPSESGGEGLRLSDYMGALIILRAKEFKDIATAAYGEKEAAICDLWIVGDADAPQGSEIAVWNGVVIGTMKRAFEKGRPMVVGIVDQGAPKAGQNAAVILTDPTDEEFTEAVEWYKVRTGGAKRTASGNGRTRPAAAEAPAPAPATSSRRRAPVTAAPADDDSDVPF